MKKFSGQLKQAGISLLEVLLALAIIAIIYTMAMQYFTTASDNQKLNMVRTFIGADMAALQGYSVNNNGYMNSDGSAGVQWTDLVNSGYLSKDTKSLNCSAGDSGTTCQQMTPWGDQVALNSDSDPITMTFPLPNGILCNNLQQSYGTTIINCGSDSSTGATEVTVYVNGYTGGSS